MNKKIFITGASGFAGSYLARELSKSEVSIYGTYLSDKSLTGIKDIPHFTPVKLDLMNADDVIKVIAEIKPDEIYHLAAMASSAQSFSEPGLVMTNNILAELNLLEAVRKTEIKPKIMIISSAEVYGKVDPKDLPMDEDTPLMPTSPYAVSKIAQDFLGLQSYIAYNLDILRIRPFNHIGPGQTEQFSTSAFAKKIAEIEKGKREPILTVGNLDTKRDFTDVRDMVRAYILLMEKGKVGDVYNIGSGKYSKMSDVLNILLSLSTSQVKVETDPKLLRPSENSELLCDNSKITSVTGWVPEIPLEKSLQDILEYWREII